MWPPGTPTAIETSFGWVLTGKTNGHSHSTNQASIASLHTTIASSDDTLRMFWEVEENPKDATNLSMEERSVMKYFQETHSRPETGRFIIPLAKNPQSKQLGKPRSHAVSRFHSLEDFAAVMNKYFELQHAAPK